VGREGQRVVSPEVRDKGVLKRGRGGGAMMLIVLLVPKLYARDVLKGG
jgi:hypothetical protein